MCRTLFYLEGVLVEILNAVLSEEQPVQGLEFLHHGRGEVRNEVGGQVQQFQPVCRYRLTKNGENIALGLN
jgi:hypothetical protein